MSKHVLSKLHNDEARAWNMNLTNVARRSYMMGYLNQELHVLNILNIKGSHRNLAAMSPTEKNQYLQNYSQYVHRSTDNLDVFYSNFNKTRTILFHALESRLVYFGHKIERLFVPKFYHDRKNKNFLKNLQYIGEYDKIDKIFFLNFLICLAENSMNIENQLEILKLFHS